MNRTNISTHLNGRATMVTGTGSPPLALKWWRCDGWLLPGWDRWDGWTRWGVGGTGVRRADVSNRQNRSATMGARTGAPLLALEGRQSMRSGSGHQLCRCCKDAYYLCWRIKIIQIECTQIRTSIVRNLYNILYYVRGSDFCAI